MRWCGWCNTSFGEQEHSVIVDGNHVHERCEQSYRNSEAAKKRRRLHIPSLAGPCADEPSGGYGKGKL